MTVKVILMKSGEDVISDAQEIIDKENKGIIAYHLKNPYVMQLQTKEVEEAELLVEGETLSSSGASNTLLNIVLVIAGFVLLVVGGEMTIENGVEVAQLMGVSEVVIGMFVLAVGTSLPELVTSAIAAYKKETDLALGNIVGSNIFNSLVVLPAAAIIRPLPIPKGGDWDLAVGGLFVLVMIPLFLFSNAKLGRLAGVGLLFGYFFYLYLRFNF